MNENDTKPDAKVLPFLPSTSPEGDVEKLSPGSAEYFAAIERANRARKAKQEQERLERTRNIMRGLGMGSKKPPPPPPGSKGPA